MLTKIVPLVAIIVIGILDAYAISKGMNGVLLATSIAVIAGLGGFAVKAKLPPPSDKDRS